MGKTLGLDKSGPRREVVRLQIVARLYYIDTLSLSGSNYIGVYVSVQLYSHSHRRFLLYRLMALGTRQNQMGNIII